MSKFKKLGILITTHNSQNFIEKLIEDLYSLPGFDNEEINVYVYDDASSDSTIEILQNLTIKYKFSFFLNQKNLGILHARNKLIDVAEEEYIMFIDDDDFISKESLLEFKKDFNKYDVMILKRKFVFKDITIIHNDWYKSRRNKIESFFTYTHGFFLTGIFIKKNIYKNKNVFFFNEPEMKINYFEDVPLYMMMIYLSSNPIILDSFYLYNKQNEKSLLTAANYHEKYESIKYLITSINTKIESLGINDTVFYNMLKIVNIRLLYYMLLSNGQKFTEELKEYFRKYVGNKKNIVLSKGDLLNYYVLKHYFIFLIYKFLKHPK